MVRVKLGWARKGKGAKAEIGFWKMENRALTLITYVQIQSITRVVMYICREVLSLHTVIKKQRLYK